MSERALSSPAEQEANGPLTCPFFDLAQDAEERRLHSVAV